MSFTFVAHSDAADLTSTATPAYPGFTVADGEDVLILVVASPSISTTTVSDSINNYTQIGSTTSDSTDGFTFSLWYKSGVAAVSSGTLTVTNSAAGGDNAVIWLRMTGLGAAQSGPAYVRTASIASGSNNVSAGALTASSEPGTLVAIEINLAGTNSQTAGTGFTLGGNLVNLPSSGFGWGGAIEAIAISDLSAHTAHFTDSGTGNTAVAFAAMFSGVSSGAALAGSADSISTATGALKTGAALAAGAASVSDAAGTLTDYASVTLEAPLYTGTGGILDPNAGWTNGAPGVGSVVYYDPTDITIETDGELVSTSNTTTALAQFYNGSSWSSLLVSVTPDMVAYAGDVSAATGALSTAIRLAGAASDSTSASGTLKGVAAALTGAAASVSSASGALVTQIKLAANAVSKVAVEGALSSAGQMLAGNAQSVTEAAAALSTQIELAGHLIVQSALTAALSTQIQFDGGASDASSATGHLSTGISLRGSVSASTAAAAALTTQVMLDGAAQSISVAASALSTQIQLAGSAAATSEASATLAQVIDAAASVVVTATGSLTTAIRAAGDAAAASEATGSLSTGISLSGHAAVMTAVPTALLIELSEHAVVFVEAPDTAGGAVLAQPFKRSMQVGEVCFVGIDWSQWLSNQWAPDAMVQVSQSVRIGGGWQATCTGAGITGSDPPSWPLYTGGEVMDGSVTWQIEPADDTSLATTLEDAVWSAPAGIAAYGAGDSNQIALAVVDTFGAESGDTYTVTCTAQMADGQTKVAVILVHVQ